MNSIIYPMIIIYIGRNYWVIILLLGFIHLNHVRIKFLLDVINNMWACNPIKIMNLWARLTTYFYMCFLKTLLLQVPHIRAQPPWWLGQRDSALWWMLPTTAAAGHLAAKASRQPQQRLAVEGKENMIFNNYSYFFVQS